MGMTREIRWSASRWSEPLYSIYFRRKLVIETYVCVCSRYLNLPCLSHIYTRGVVALCSDSGKATKSHVIKNALVRK